MQVYLHIVSIRMIFQLNCYDLIAGGVIALKIKPESNLILVLQTKKFYA